MKTDNVLDISNIEGIDKIIMTQYPILVDLKSR